MENEALIDHGKGGGGATLCSLGNPQTVFDIDAITNQKLPMKNSQQSTQLLAEK
jgi:hypothetical protein